MGRRSVLAGAAGVALAAGVTGVAGCSVPEPPGPTHSADPAPGRPVSTGERALLMQFAAHPDDDLYFMNPDTQRMLDAGVPLVSVYVTAGEHNGKNTIKGMPERKPDKPAYSAARHQGLRQAYAVLLGADKFTPWQKRVATLAGGRRAEVDTLVHEGRRVELVFLNLPMHHPRHYMAVPALWESRELRLTTVLAADSPVPRADTYDHAGLIEVIAGLLATYRPTVVHTLDPDPDIQEGSAAQSARASEQPGYSDHGDHTAVACFTWAGLLRRVADATAAGGPVPAFTTNSFRGYYNKHWPKNLPPAVLAEKAAHLVPYGGDPEWDCGNPSGCGDYGVSGDRPLTNWKGWVRSTHYRWPAPGPAVTEESGGRLVAYGVLGLRAVRWREREEGTGVFEAPEDLGGGPLAPALSSVTLADGRVLLFGVRFAALAGRGGPNRRELVLLEQRSPGGPFLAWRGLGNPEHTDDRGRRIGAPVAVAAPDGRVHLFVRDAGKGVATRVRAVGGAWGPWRTLPGDGSHDEIQDGLTTLLGDSGRVHLLAPGRDHVRHWVDGSPAEPLPISGDPVAAVPGPGPVGVEVFYRAPADGELRSTRGDAPRFEGYGLLAAAEGPRGPVLMGRDARHRIQLLSGGRLLTRDRGTVPAGPAATLHGATTVVGMGADARPWVWRPVR
ncbi:PIG-L family deacetylase [Streptomyces sp. NPDC090025]|uniref:PIG-L family deacetylase n=1 Tax=Streptomyces sp. NPDC090025 TaxID=3365922 RepID=UPI0038346031